MTKNCVIVLTHRSDKYNIKYLKYLQNECKGIMDFYIIYTGNKEDLSMLDGINYIYKENKSEGKNEGLIPTVIKSHFRIYEEMTIISLNYGRNKKLN